MPPVKVLIVDDSALMRRLVARLLEATGDFVVIDTAADGEEAVKKICALRPEAVSLDLEMPVLDGLGVLRQVMRRCPTPVVMLSSHTTKGARATMQALSLGAVDFVAKPEKPGYLDVMVAELALKLKTAAMVSSRKLALLKPALLKTSLEKPSSGRAAGADETRSPVVAERLPLEIPKGSLPERLSEPERVYQAAPGTPPESPAAAGETGPARPARGTEAVRGKAGRVDLVVVGSSTGGPAALQVLIPALPADFPAAVVVVQHLPPGFSRSLAEHLARRSRLQVKHAEAGDPVAPGQVLVAPAGCDLAFRGRAGSVSVRLESCGEPRSPGVFRPSVDGVMTSAAELYGAHAMGVLLTGMGRDGAKGMAAIRERGGPTIAEAESTCVVFGMPKAAIEAGAAQKVLPLGEIAGEIVKMI
ncbi:MAG: chemotaxis-specific protein-glutamate methyltransferase CheB [Bacillota bacterium]